MDEETIASVIPGESETIAAKRSARLADKMRINRGRVNPGVWGGAFLEGLGVIGVVVLNLLTVFQFLGTAAPATEFSGPAMPVLAKLFEVFGFDFAYGLQLVNTFFFLGFIGGFYVLVKMVTGRRLTAFLAILLVSLPLFPFAEGRIRLSFVGRDSPHVASLAVVMLAVASVIGFMREGGGSRMVVSAILVTIVGLVSPTGFLSMVVFLVVSLFSEMLLGNGRLKAMRVGTVLALSAGLASFWYSPGFLYWLVMGPVGSDLRIVLGKMVPISMFAVPVIAIFGYLLFDRKPNWQPFFLALFYTLSFIAVSLAGGGAKGWVRSRFVSEVGISVAFLGGILILKVFDRARLAAKSKWVNWLAWVGMGIVLLGTTGTIGLLRERVYKNSDMRVLGLWTGVEKDQIWEKRDEFLASPLANVGTVVSSITVIGMVGMVVLAERKVVV
jgi:hypothetical protein